MIQPSIRVILVVLLLSLFASAAWAQDAEIIASLQRVEGTVSVVRATDKETVQGRNGLLLRAGDTVQTAAEGLATIKFRDGSEIRLFPNTHFVVEAKEREGSGRFFNVNLIMKAGSFWGNFVKQRQVANITTPTATIGIKGTTLRVVERDAQARVALTEGQITVSNEREQVELQPGQRLPSFNRADTLADKVEAIPFKLDLRSDQRKLEFRDNKPEEEPALRRYRQVRDELVALKSAFRHTHRPRRELTLRNEPHGPPAAPKEATAPPPDAP